MGEYAWRNTSVKVTTHNVKLGFPAAGYLVTCGHMQYLLSVHEAAEAYEGRSRLLTVEKCFRKRPHPSIQITSLV